METPAPQFGRGPQRINLWRREGALVASQFERMGRLDLMFASCHDPGVNEQADRWERHDWWGVVLDTDDVETLTRFYADLRGWSIHRLDERDGSLDAGEGVAYLNIQYNPAYIRPVWPGRTGEQQMMLHLDFEVVDLEAEVDRAVALGAELPEYQPQTNVRVLLDPSGHPFCLYAG